MGKLIKWFAGTTILLAGNLYSQSVEITWDKNWELDLAGYIVYYGDESRIYSYSVNVGLDTQVSIINSTYLEYGKTYYFAVTAFDSSMNESILSDEISTVIDGQFENFDPSQTTKEYRLNQNHPNPFNPITRIRFQLPEANHVILKIYDLLGTEIRTLVDGPYEAGHHIIDWDSSDDPDKPVSSGIYLYRMQTGSFSQVRKMTLLR